MEITISGKDKKLMEQVKNLAKKLGLRVTTTKIDTKITPKNNGEELYKLMREKAASGGIKSIKDPVAWQREQRKERPLYGRNE